MRVVGLRAVTTAPTPTKVEKPKAEVAEEKKEAKKSTKK